MKRRWRAAALVVTVALVVTLTQSLVPGMAPAGAELPVGTSLLAWVEEGEVWVAESDGTAKRSLSGDLDTPVVNEGAPMWTPDGQAVVVGAQDGEGAARVAGAGWYVLGLDGTTTALPGTGSWYSPEKFGVSPDGTVLGLVSGSTLATVPLDGSAPPTPIDTDGIPAGSPAWSPEGNRVAFQTPCCSPIDTNVYVVDLTSEDPPVLISDGDDFQAQNPVFSPDGSRVAFEAIFPNSVPAERVNNIVVGNADGSGSLVGIAPRSTSTDNRGGGSWSPDSSTIAFQGSTDLGGSYDVFVAPSDASAAPTLVSTVGGTWIGIHRHPWSPDGSRLFYRGSDDELFVVGIVPASAPLQLLSTGGKGSNPAWHPDGTRIAVRVEAEGSGAPAPAARAVAVNGLYVTSADGSGSPTLITEGVDTYASWSPLRPPEQEFTDVPTDHPFFAEISWLVAEGITTGYPDGTFKPDRRVNRQAMAAFLYRLAGEPAFTPPGAPSFSDVGASHPFFTEIEWLASTGITGGFPDGTFRPGGEVSRQAMAAFLYRFAGEPAFTPPGTPTFPDVAASHPFFTEIEWLASTAITGGFPDGGFKPSRGVTRQAMAAFLYRYVDAGLPT